ncbi:4035_t:CDS:2 [Dentiscutata erythropus]|uniref:4035_t:CDS:1 n=1 Tax=Dentiscutata erythropus TaxID=1348616 RepID=A0A9N9IJH5_9GLOM|nr:4035_t:CDS:2 [Dentiscutata erythropus]
MPLSEIGCNYLELAEFRAKRHQQLESKSNATDILAQSLYWLGLDEESTVAQQKRNQLPDHSQLEEILTRWFDLALENHLTITGLILQEKAKQIAAALNIQNFAASDVYTSHCGEATSAPIERLSEFCLSLQNETSNYNPIDIYNCDKTALYWFLEPSKLLTYGHISGIKKPKNHITVMLTCNTVGDKLLPLFIHKFENPHAIRGIKKSLLPVQYYWNKKAWMQTSIFQNWLSDLDQRMRYAHRKIFLLLDNCLAHSIKGLNLRNVKVVFLPERTTTWLQPCDADPVTIYDAIQFVAQAWNKVFKDTIIHSWHKTGILPSMETNEDANLETIDLTNEEEIELENLISWFQISKNSKNSEDLNISLYEFIEIDNNYAIGEMPTIEDIIAEIQENEYEEESEQQIKPVMAIQAITGLDSVLGYIEQSEPSIEIDIKVFAIYEKS